MNIPPGTPRASAKSRRIRTCVLSTSQISRLRPGVSRRRSGVEVKTATAVGHAAQSILQKAVERGYDLIVIGHTGHSGVWGTLLGSTTARVVDQAPCDVIVVR